MPTAWAAIDPAAVERLHRDREALAVLAEETDLQRPAHRPARRQRSGSVSPSFSSSLLTSTPSDAPSTMKHETLASVRANRMNVPA